MSYSKTPESSKYSCTDHTKDAKNWTFFWECYIGYQYPVELLTRVTLYATLLWLLHIQNTCQSFWMCIHQQDHCAHHWIQISSTLPQQGQSHMDIEHLRTRDPSAGTGSLAALELWKKRTHSKDTYRQHYFSRIHKISTLSHYHFILLFIINSCVHCCSVLFPHDCLAWLSL